MTSNTAEVTTHRSQLISTGFGFVEFYDDRDAEDAIYDMDNRRIDGHRLRVEWSRGAKKSMWLFVD